MEILLLIALALFVAERGWFKGLLAFAGYGILGALIGIILFIVGIALLVALVSALAD